MREEIRVHLCAEMLYKGRKTTTSINGFKPDFSKNTCIYRRGSFCTIMLVPARGLFFIRATPSRKRLRGAKSRGQHYRASF